MGTALSRNSQTTPLLCSLSASCRCLRVIQNCSHAAQLHGCIEHLIALGHLVAVALDHLVAARVLPAYLETVSSLGWQETPDVMPKKLHQVPQPHLVLF